jgi:hypothetical protein
MTEDERGEAMTRHGTRGKQMEGRVMSLAAARALFSFPFLSLSPPRCLAGPSLLFS